MITTMNAMMDRVRTLPTQRIAVACAADKEVLCAVEEARRQGLAEALLVGDAAAIGKVAADNGIDPANYEIEDCPDKAAACASAVLAVREGRAALPMKGHVDTSVLLRAVLNKEAGLNAGQLMCHVGLIEAPGFDRLLLLSDCAMSLAPGLEDKASIIRSCVLAANALDIDEPKVAVICAVEKVNEKMPCTLDAAELTAMNERGELPGCLVKGPLQLDIAVSGRAAREKGVDHPVAGRADVLVVPDLEAGNVLIKSLEYFAKAGKAGAIMGARAPVILTSHASEMEAKLYSIAFGLLLAAKGGNNG